MTLDEIKLMADEVITPYVAAKVLKCNPQWIRVTARKNRKLLGFPIIIVGNRIKIPRLAFIRFMEGANK